MDTERLFLSAERLAREFNLFPTADPESSFSVRGLLSPAEIQAQLASLERMDIDSYIETVVSPAELPNRPTASDAVQALGNVEQATHKGAYFDALVEMDFENDRRVVGFVAQNRTYRNGEWGPEEHSMAAEFVQSCARRAIPIVSLMDTPGAAADEMANRGNQAHNISRLIAVMSDVDVPNIGVIFGIGYSGGAIPLAASNMILSVRDGLFSTIQPRGLANIARRLNLSWQECAKHVGLSPYELMGQGNIDGIIDYVPGESGDKLENFRQAIITGISSVEASTKAFVAQERMFLSEYEHVLNRYLYPTERMKQTESASLFEFVENPTDYLNVFGLAYRFSRFLRVRRRIKSTGKGQYGRLVQRDIPEGELSVRQDQDRRRTFLKWLQDPDRIVYDDGLRRTWRNYLSTKAAAGETRGRFGRFFLGEPRKNFENARKTLLSVVGSYLVNRWKTDAAGNLLSLIDYLQNESASLDLIESTDIESPRILLRSIATDSELGPALRERFTHYGRKLLGRVGTEEMADDQLSEHLAIELNLVISGEHIVLPNTAAHSDGTALVVSKPSTSYNRNLINERWGDHFRNTDTAVVVHQESAESAIETLLDIIREPDLRELFVRELQYLLVLNAVYDETLTNLKSIAVEAKSTQSLDRATVRKLLRESVRSSVRASLGKGLPEEMDLDEFLDNFFEWYFRFQSTVGLRKFLSAVEEWKKASYPYISDTLFVVVTFFFENLVVSLLTNELEGKRFNGRIKPRNIGRKKDFWNRLNNAYRDLQIQEVLTEYKRTRNTSYESFRDMFFEDFDEMFADLLSSDPCEFPGFRLSIEAALEQEKPPCGVVTGVGNFKGIEGGLRVGAVISNSSFQAGAFDMASAEKFCRLLQTCAEERLPLICFISSGGMQTKEGAGALFSMAAINDRITHFVRDYDLPVIVFGYGDCTGGAQASFVTHPFVHTYYLSGTSMPFAGQIVVPSYLPLDSILSNYLVAVPGAMQGLVKHPFYENLDVDLKDIDSEIPLPEVSIAEVVAGVMEGSLSAVRTAQMPALRDQFNPQDLYRSVRRVLVHARGCAAVKVVRTAQRIGVDVVLVQSDPDMESCAADMVADQNKVVCIGGSTPDESYLNARSVLAIAKNEGVDSLHPGIGFLSENSQFAELVRSNGINFIGPPVSSMETMGNKSNAINTAIRLGVQVVPGSHGIVADIDLAEEIAQEIGYPILIKAVHGGGGKGIQLVESPEKFHESFQRVSVEARAAFGSGDMYLERYVEKLRHIEAQILRDKYGNTKVLGIRDCSVQRNKQKIFEESGSTMLPERYLEQIQKDSEAIANQVEYVGAGTLEFIYDVESDNLYFMEMNTRLQVEHPVTELVSGVDIVGQQFAIAGGSNIEKMRIERNGYAIEARVNAERLVRDADGNLVFRSSAGQISTCKFPKDPNVEVISIAAEGKFVSPYYDSMIAQVIARGANRKTTSQRLMKYLSKVHIEGIGTNIALLKAVLQDQVFLDGVYTTDYLEDFLVRTDADELIAEMESTMGDQSAGIDANSIAIEGSDELKVLAPTTGIFYLKPTPTENDYVIPNENITTDRTLCQIEAFKVFTPLRLRDLNVDSNPLYPEDRDYKITRINVSSGQQVNAGDLLFVVQPNQSPP
ncbi:MAG: ATP-grasp domain-containing protein [Gammaproteobacteria bacterium]|nr:ATP-grasp domain-containing protein [Gammaproteobacteria bacterium]